MPSRNHSAGENGERIALLLGESVAGEYDGDWGIRSLRNEVGVRAEIGGRAECGGRTKGEGGIIGAEDALCASLLQEHALPALEGADVGVDFPDLSENTELFPVDGLETAGDSALRNSVYAIGGVMGVLRSSSCLMISRKPGAGLRGSSEGSVADRGVVSPDGRADRGVRNSEGRADRGVLMVGSLGVWMVGVLRAGKVGLGDAEGMMTFGIYPSCTKDRIAK